jgi:hypothetical protein
MNDGVVGSFPLLGVSSSGKRHAAEWEAKEKAKRDQVAQTTRAVPSVVGNR